jgi:hypothetical protein
MDSLHAIVKWRMGIDNAEWKEAGRYTQRSRRRLVE